MSLLAAVPVPQKLGIAFAVILVIGWLVFIVAHVRRDTEPRGAEMEVAPNRKPYYEDDELEGPKLERVLGMALVLLIIIAVGLPLYWWHEPSRQAGAVVYFNKADKGGHFAAWEEPEVFTTEVRAAFRSLR